MHIHRSLPSWLTSIEASRVAPEVRLRLEDFQKECADVLADHFFGKRGADTTAAELADLRADVRAMRAERRVAAFTLPVAVVGVGRANSFKYVMTLIARARASRSGRSLASERGTLHTAMRGAFSFPAAEGNAWENLPAEKGSVLEALLASELAREEAVAFPRAPRRTNPDQTVIPFDIHKRR